MNIVGRTLNAIQHTSITLRQNEGANLDYSVNWGPAIHPDTIATSTWSTDGITISDAANTTTTATAKLTGSQGYYTVTNEIVTADGITDSRTIRLVITDNDSYTPGDYD